MMIIQIAHSSVIYFATTTTTSYIVCLGNRFCLPKKEAIWYLSENKFSIYKKTYYVQSLKLGSNQQ